MKGAASVKYILLSVLFVIASINFTKTTLEVVKSSKRLDDVKNQVSSLEHEKESLQESIEYKKTDDYVEEKARNDLNLAKTGEKLFVVQDSRSPKKTEQKNVLGAANTSSSAKKTEEKESNLSLWFKLFF